MAFNGSGTFLRLYSWIADAAAAIKISSTRMDAEMDGMATGLSNCITKDGQTTPTQNLPMGTFRHTGVGDSSALDSYPSSKQIQNGTITYDATDTGVANAYVAGLSPAPTAYVDGMDVYLKIVNTNTGASTINLNALGVKNIKTPAGADPGAGAIVAGQIAHFKYNSTNFLLLTEANIVHTTGNETIAGTKTFTKAIWTAEGADIASASSTNIWSAGDGNTVHVTGSVTITTWGTAPQAGAGMWVIFDGVLQLTYNATTNKLNNNGANYTTVAGDRAFVYAETTTSFLVTLFPLIGYNNNNIQTFLSSGTWTKPSLPPTSKVVIELWAGGGSGARGETGNMGGGGGGGYSRLETVLSALGATESVTIGPGGAAVTSAGNGLPGSNSNFGALLVAYYGGGGGSGATGSGGGGGGELGQGTSAVASTVGVGGLGIGGTSGSGASVNTGGTGGLNNAAGENAHSLYSGSGGGGGGAVGGNAYYGAAGGSGSGGGNVASANSINGGDGGSVTGGIGTAGSVPGGGGAGSVAANSGAGAAGKCIVTVYPG